MGRGSREGSKRPGGSQALLVECACVWAAIFLLLLAFLVGLVSKPAALRLVALAGRVRGTR